MLETHKFDLIKVVSISYNVTKVKQIILGYFMHNLIVLAFTRVLGANT